MRLLNKDEQKVIAMVSLTSQGLVGIAVAIFSCTKQLLQVFTYYICSYIFTI